MNCKAIHGNIQSLALNQPKRINDRAMFSLVGSMVILCDLLLMMQKLAVYKRRKVQIDSSLLQQTIRKIEKKVSAIVSIKIIKNGFTKRFQQVF